MHHQNVTMSGKLQNRINSDICVSTFSGGLRFHVSSVHMCLCVCELFCTLADLLPLLSVIFHLFLTFPPPSPCQPTLALEWGRSRGSEWTNLLRTWGKHRQMLVVTKVYVTHTSIKSSDTDLSIFIHPLMHKCICTNTSSHIYAHSGAN